eukprot:6111466-Amphidinium_carterae.1
MLYQRLLQRYFYLFVRLCAFVTARVRVRSHKGANNYSTLLEAGWALQVPDGIQWVQASSQGNKSARPT